MDIMTKIFNRQNNPMKILQDIKHEFSDINKQTSLIQKVMSSIDSREACLDKIIALIQQLQGEQMNAQKLSRLFEEKINHLRILTVHCIECIYQWKQSIEPLILKNIKLKYLINNKSYLSKILEDYKQIVDTKISEIYGFDPKKIDIFFTNYTFEGKKMSVVSKNIVKRIRMCEMLLNEDENKVPQEQQSKRTPLIHKMKSPPISRQDKSMPPRGVSSTLQKWKKIQIQYTQFHEYFTISLNKSSFGKSFASQVQLPRYEELTIFQNSQTSQEIVLGIDKNASQRKIIIFLIKSNNDNVENSIKSLCQYLWEHDNCNQVRISLLHLKIGDILSVDIQLQKKLKSVGFRWVSVNHNQNTRTTIYGMKRPLNTVAHKTARRKQAYPIIIQHLAVLQLSENLQKGLHNKCSVSVFSIIDLLKETNKQHYQQICKRDQFSRHLENMNKIQVFLSQESKKMGISQGYETSFEYSGLRAFQIENEEKLSKVFRNVEISEKKVPTNFSKYIALMNTSFKFKNFIISNQKYTKFLPSKDNQILICQSNYPIYLLQSDEENINFFIIEVQENFQISSIDSIFHAMGQQSSFLDDFWLPIFHKTMDYVDEVGFRNSEIISTDYWSALGSLKRKGNKKRTKIIKPPFVFGMIHKRLLQMLEVPFYCTLIKKEDII